MNCTQKKFSMTVKQWDWLLFSHLTSYIKLVCYQKSIAGYMTDHDKVHLCPRICATTQFHVHQRLKSRRRNMCRKGFCALSDAPNRILCTSFSDMAFEHYARGDDDYISKYSLQRVYSISNLTFKVGHCIKIKRTEFFFEM